MLNQHDYFVATSVKHHDGVDLHDSPEQVYTVASEWGSYYCAPRQTWNLST